MKTVSLYIDNTIWDRIISDSLSEGARLKKRVPVGRYLAEFYMANVKKTVEDPGKILPEKTVEEPKAEKILPEKSIKSAKAEKLAMLKKAMPENYERPFSPMPKTMYSKKGKK